HSLLTFKHGDMVTGTVTVLTSREVFFDVGGKTEGAVFGREYKAATDIIRKLKVGDKVPCFVVFPENETGQLVLSLTRAGGKLVWDELFSKKTAKEAVDIVIIDVNRGGALVEFRGLRGFLPGSHLVSIKQEDLEKSRGKSLKAYVLDIDQTQNRLIFSESPDGAGRPKKIFEATTAQKEAIKKIKIGGSYEGRVAGIAPFGLFVETEGIGGLVHISEISWEKIVNLGEHFKVDDKVKVVVLGIAENDTRLNLSMKQLLPDPWQELVKSYAAGQTVSGVVSKITSFGAFVEIDGRLTGLIHLSKIPAGVELAEGQKTVCVIEQIEPSKHRIGLSLIPTEKPMGYR
ncbi:MAG: S1 RNA-binding domain-containing protein, partial [bacterium]|nr:S1 RNA-binding domain-containing protein [bacterium]